MYAESAVINAVSASPRTAPSCKTTALAPVSSGNRPWVTAILGALSLLLFLVPEISQLLDYRRDAIQAGQLWRLITSHLTHWSPDHLAWSLLVFFGCSCFWEIYGERRRAVVQEDKPLWDPENVRIRA